MQSTKRALAEQVDRVSTNNNVYKPVHKSVWTVKVDPCELCHICDARRLVRVPNNLPVNLYVMLLHSSTWKLGQKTIFVCENCQKMMHENFKDSMIHYDSLSDLVSYVDMHIGSTMNASMYLNKTTK